MNTLNDFEWGEFVRHNGRIMVVQDSYDEERPEMIGLQSEEDAKVYDHDWSERFSKVEYYPISEIERLIPVKADSSAVRALFRMDKTPWQLAEEGSFPFSDDAEPFNIAEDTSFEDVDLPDIDERRFGIDNKKVVLESVLSVYEDAIPLENKGSGMESLVKTQIALNREDNLDTILIEEPENHLCFANLKQMLQQIMDHEEDSQIILTTHSNMIASRLNLGNVIWIAEGHYLSLKDVDPQTSAFF